MVEMVPVSPTIIEGKLRRLPLRVSSAEPDRNEDRLLVKMLNRRALGASSNIAPFSISTPNGAAVANVAVAEPFRELVGRDGHVVRDEDEHNRRDDHVKRSPTPSGEDDEDALRVSCEPEVILNDEGLEGALPDEREGAR